MHVHKENTKTKMAPNINVTWTPFQFALRLGVFLKLAWYFFSISFCGPKDSRGCARFCETCISNFRESHGLSALCISCQVDRLRADMLREAGLQVTPPLPRK